MSRTAEEVLEFDKLRELLRLRTTSATGRRSVDALQFSQDRHALEAEFALIREAREWLRAERELGFGALADPQGWLEKIAGPGMVLEGQELLDASTLLETSAWLRQQFREEAAKFPLLTAGAMGVGDFRELHAAIRRCVLPGGEISDAEANSAVAKRRGR
jgi:dsDNA-specific endonuclease/ATPase MutS2